MLVIFYNVTDTAKKMKKNFVTPTAAFIKHKSTLKEVCTVQGRNSKIATEMVPLMLYWDFVSVAKNLVFR